MLTSELSSFPTTIQELVSASRDVFPFCHHGFMSETIATGSIAQCLKCPHSISEVNQAYMVGSEILPSLVSRPVSAAYVAYVTIVKYRSMLSGNGSNLVVYTRHLESTETRLLVATIRRDLGLEFHLYEYLGYPVMLNTVKRRYSECCSPLVLIFLPDYDADVLGQSYCSDIDPVTVDKLISDTGCIRMFAYPNSVNHYVQLNLVSDIRRRDFVFTQGSSSRLQCGLIVISSKNISEHRKHYMEEYYASWYISRVSMY